MADIVGNSQLPRSSVNKLKIIEQHGSLVRLEQIVTDDPLVFMNEDEALNPLDDQPPPTPDLADDPDDPYASVRGTGPFDDADERPAGAQPETDESDPYGPRRRE